MLSRLFVNVGRKSLFINVNSQKAAVDVFTKNKYVLNVPVPVHAKYVGLSSFRYQSTINTNAIEIPLNNAQTAAPVDETIENVTSNISSGINAVDKPLISELPDIPTVQKLAELLIETHANGEPTLESIGLGGYSPLGLIQKSIESLHIYVDMPWWQAIAVVTITMRLLLLPLTIKSQKISAEMQSFYPEQQKLQQKVKEAKLRGDDYEAAVASYEYAAYMKKLGGKPLKPLLYGIIQVPIYISMFVGLKRMVYAPVESFKDGGALWFPNLVIPDTYYLLPVMNGIAMATAVEFGGAPKLGGLKYIMRAVPIVVIAFTLSMPAAVQWYWLCISIISTTHVLVFRMKPVREYFKIPELLPRPVMQVTKGGTKSSFLESFRESMANMKMGQQVINRREADERLFRASASGPIQKTYKYDPTKDVRKSM